LFILFFSGDAFRTDTPFKALRGGDFLSLSKEERLRLTELHVAGRGRPFDKGGVPGCWDIPEFGWASKEEHVKQDMNPKRHHAVGAKRNRTASPRGAAAAAVDTVSSNGEAAASPEGKSCSETNTNSAAASTSMGAKQEVIKYARSKVAHAPIEDDELIGLLCDSSSYFFSLWMLLNVEMRLAVEPFVEWAEGNLSPMCACFHR
jgi:hypothetical protein